MYYDELLKLCGYEPQEIERERPRIEKTLEKLELTSDDIARGEKRINKYFDIELKGVRKVLGVWLKGLVDLILAKEERKKIVYYSYPPFSQIAAIMSMISEDIYVSAPELILDHTMGIIFNKLNPFLEAAEGDLLPPGLANCSLLQARLGGILKGVVPIPDLLMPSGFLCDQAPKLDELIGHIYGVPVVYVDSVHDEMGLNWPASSERRVRYSAQEAREAMAKFEEVTGYKLTPEEIAEKHRRFVNIFMGYMQIQDLVKADPLPIRQTDLGIAFNRVASLDTTTAFADLRGIMDILYGEVRERVDKGIGVMEKGTPRVMIVLPWFSDPSVVRMIQDSGLAVVAHEGLETSASEGVRRRFKDRWERFADVNLRRGIRYCGLGLARHYKTLCEDWNLDGAIISFLFSCRAYAIPNLKAKELITKELGIPALILESDCYDTRDYSAEAMRTRVETFAEIVKASKAAKAK